MSPLGTAKVLSYGRIAFGLAGVVAPQTWSRWVGRVATQPDGQVLVRGFGARDVLLGALALHVADRKGVGSRTVGAIAVMDVVDCGSTLAARQELPSSSVIGTVVTAGGAALAGFWAAGNLPR
jgi:uncharacterized protein YjeT (DUF2065 family)